MNKKNPGEAHSHMWLVGILGLIAGLTLMLYVPTLKPVSDVLFLFAGFHLVGGGVALASLYMMSGGKLFGRLLHRKHGDGAAAGRRLDFGWAPSWIFGPLVAAVALLATSVALAVSAPHLWPLAITSVLLAASFFAGHLAAAGAADPAHASLPMVDLVSGERDLVLDAGCGAGRTTIAVSRTLRNGRIVALDKFNSDYIDGGGRTLLERNLAVAALADRVDIREGDLTQLPFADGSFDAAVSAHAMDHLGPGKQKGLSEMRRVLRPGGRFLLVVWVPGWTMFAIANVLSFILTPKAGWRRMAGQAGFNIREEGSFNGMWYLLLEAPALPSAAQ